MELLGRLSTVASPIDVSSFTLACIEKSAQQAGPLTLGKNMKKLAAVLGLLVLSLHVQAIELRLPFNGRWFVAQGGDTLNVNDHMKVRAQWYGIDFMKTGGPNQRSLAKTTGTAVEDFYSWGAEVLSPVAGEIVSTIDSFPDNPLGTKDTKNPAGNHVIIKADEHTFVFLAHMQKGSIKVKTGDHVDAGQVLGLCGNSGNTTAPHIHMHIQEAPTFNEGAGQNPIFHAIDVDLTGKHFAQVDWPVIRGLFVEQNEPDNASVPATKAATTAADTPAAPIARN